MKRLNEKNDKYIQSFCAEAIEDGFVASYELDKIYQSAFRAKFHDEFPDFYIDIIGRNWKEDRVGFSTSEDATYEQVSKEFSDFISKFEGGADNAKLKSAFSYAVKDVAYKGNGEFYQYFQYGMNKIDSLFYILRYVISNEIDSDRGEVQEIMKNHNINSTTVMFKDTFHEFGNLQIIAMANGKIKIKGLSSEEELTLQHLYDLIKG